MSRAAATAAASSGATVVVVARHTNLSRALAALSVVVAAGAAGAVGAACGGGTLDATPGAFGDGGGGGDARPSGPSGLPCDVDDVLARRCQDCHTSPPRFGAPMPLVTSIDLHAPSKSDPSKPVYVRVGEKIHDKTAPMPQPPNAPLSTADAKTLDDWIAASAPKFDGTCGGSTGGDGGGLGPQPLSCTPDTHLAPPSPWTMPRDQTDEYVCYGVEANVTSKRHIVALSPKIDNTSIVHHVLLFQADEAVSSTPTPCSGGGSIKWRLVYGWAPGGKNLEMPPEAGFPVEQGTHFVVQIHYNNLNGLSGQQDKTGFDLCTTDKLRPNDADVMAFGTTKFTIPAHATEQYDCSVSVPSDFDGLRLIYAFPHMHRLGKQIETKLVSGSGGAPVDLGGAPAWDFNNQAWQSIDATLHGGDEVRTSCTWTNDTPADVSFGENTGDEMCYSFTMYYPRITATQWSWIVPAATSSCTHTP